MPETVQFHRLEIDDPRRNQTVEAQNQRKLCIRLDNSKPTGLCWCDKEKPFVAQNADWQQEASSGYSQDGGITGIGLIFSIVKGTLVSSCDL